MTADPRSTVETYFTSWRQRDFETLRSTLADTGSFRGPLGGSDDADEYLSAMRGTAAIMTDIVVHHVFVQDSEVLTWFTLHTTVAAPVETASRMKISGGRITEVNAIFDPRGLLAAIPPT